MAPVRLTEDARQKLAAWQPDLLVVCDYGQILSRELLAVAPLGGINLHGSLLPKYRGAAPVHWAVDNGDAETGVTVIHTTPRHHLLRHQEALDPPGAAPILKACALRPMIRSSKVFR